MSRHNHKKSRLKYVFLAFTCAAAFSFSGIASACGNKKPAEEETDKTTSREDTQLLKNGNFEFFNIPDTKEGGNKPEYLIKTPNNWSHGGSSSYSMSGIISTSEWKANDSAQSAWEKLTDKGLAGKLDFNNNLDSSSSEYLSKYVDYNGMTSHDILYKDQYKGLLEVNEDEDSEDDEDKEEIEPEEVRKETIANPGTHYNVINEDGKLYAFVDGVKTEIFVDKNEDSKTYGDYFLEYDEDKDEYSKPISNILMLHNYATAHNGIAQNYSSVDVELPANTSAEVSVWVKTAHLKFNQGKDVSQDRGANISVSQTVGSSALDKFTISCINTEKLLSEGKIDNSYNGWAQYTIYVNACDFASTKIRIELGLGETGYTTEGYAFFDDVTVTKYAYLEQSDSYRENKDKLTGETTCVLSTDASEKIKKVDSYQRNGGDVQDRFSNNFYYLIDLASEQSEGTDTYQPVDFKNVANLKAGLTIDGDKYVSSKRFNFSTNMSGFDYSGTRLPFTSELKNSGLITESDYISYVKSSHQFTKAETDYYEKLNSALNSASDLSKNSDKYDNMLVMLSAYGAAYTTSFDLSIDRESYQIISFWVKTSDMKGNTAATVKITQKDNDDNSSSFTVDTTDKVTNIGDSDEEKDIYQGWVQCFFFVKNELEVDGETKSDDFTVEFSFGNTTIKGSNVNSYKNGWVALANMQCLTVNEDVFTYTGSGDYTASLTISEEAEKKTQVFDEVYGNQSGEIKDGIVIPSSYKGVNGKSSAVYNNGHVSIPFDEFNNNVDTYGDGNAFTGLINKEHFVDGNYVGESWFDSLLGSFGLLDKFNTSAISAQAAWTEIFGAKSVQPLVITNKTRDSYVEERGATEETFKNYLVKDKETGAMVRVADDAEFDENETYYSLKQVRNYGYLGEKKTVSADSYSTVSVRVKVSPGAVAYVYLVDTSAGKSLLNFGAPAYSFYYDIDGNVLKGEPKSNATVTEQRANIAYTLRDDGLYEDKDGKLYANLHNYSKLYYENIEYFDEDGNSYNIDDLVDSVTYYDENGNKADHYLVTTSGTKVYQFVDGAYHYIVNGKTQKEEVNPFDTAYARYDFTGVSEEYMVEIDGNKDSDWVTVTFVVHAGSEDKSYRLELWSGKRDETGVDEGDANADAEDGGVVLFDYSYTSVSDDTMKTYYEQQIIKAYLRAFAEKGLLDELKIDTTGKNIAYFEKLAKENGVAIDTVYKAHYYTFSWYDSADFVPFNEDVAGEGTTGYEYSATEQTETLAYLLVNDEDNKEYTVFADYSAIDKSITLNTSGGDHDNDNDDEDKKDDGSVWLLISSIILVVALVFAIIAIFLKDVIKKARRNRVTSKNTYDHRRANRYKKKLRLMPEAPVEEDEASAEETPEEASDEEEVSEPVEDAPEVIEEAPVEETEAPAEEPSDEEKPE